MDAVYPDAMAPQHADVILLVTLDADGKVTDVKIASSGGPAFDEAAVEAVRKWTFSPATRNGKPFAARIKIPFHFAPPPPPPAPVPPPPPPATPPPPPPPPPTRHAPAHEEIEEVHVVGPAPQPKVGASDVHYTLGQIRLVHQSPTTNASKLLESATPILLTNESGAGHAEEVFIRGFDAREGEDMEFSVDGVPINEAGNVHGNGYADTHFIIPELVQTIRVVEGPFDPRETNWGVAGAADFELGLPQRGVTASYTGGSWNTHRGVVLWGPPGTSERTFAGAEIFSSDGFGQNRDSLSGSAMGQYEGRLGDRGFWRLTAQGYATRFHSAGEIREDDYEAGRIGFYDSYDKTTYAHEAFAQGGDATRFSVAGTVESRVGSTILHQQVFLIQRDLRLLENFTGFTLDPRGDELDLHMNEQTFGAQGFARMRTTALHEKQELEVGYFARGDLTHGVQQRLEAATGNPYTTFTDLDATIGNIGLYADANLRATKWINLRGGLRADVFTYDVTDNLKPATNTAASVAPMPRASLVIGPFTGFSFSGSVGTGVRLQDTQDIVNDTSPSFANVLAFDGGVSYTHGLGRYSLLEARSVFFQTHTDKDFIFDPTVGDMVLGPGATRDGWVGSARFRSAHVLGSAVGLDESTNLTVVRATYDDTGAPVFYIPSVVFRSDTAIYGDLPWKIARSKVKASLGAAVTYVGTRPLPFNTRSGEIFTLDASLNFAWRDVGVGVTAQNLTNNQYRLGEYDYVSNFRSQPNPPNPMREFTAGPPLGVFGNLTVRFGS